VGSKQLLTYSKRDVRVSFWEGGGRRNGEEHVRREWDMKSEKKRRNGNEGKPPSDEVKKIKESDKSQWRSCLHFRILSFITIPSSPSPLVFICLSYPVPLFPLEESLIFPPHLSFLLIFSFLQVFFFSSLNNLLQQGRVEVSLFWVCLRFKQNA